MKRPVYIRKGNAWGKLYYVSCSPILEETLGKFLM